jgi:hypothetical protein
MKHTLLVEADAITARAVATRLTTDEPVQLLAAVAAAINA